MDNIDLNYICTAMGNLTGIPIRVYDGGELIFYHSIIELPKDPICLALGKLNEITAHVGYYITSFFYLYGVINSGRAKIIIGPSRQVKAPASILREMAFKCDLTGEDADTFIAGMKSITNMPYESIIQTLCTVNYILNGEKLGLDDITIFDDEQKMLKKQIESELLSREEDKIAESGATISHNSLSVEQKLTDIIRRGDSASLKEWVNSAPAIRPGILAPDQIRHYKNTFIVSATLASRAAIRGGMDIDDAFTLSDLYIQKCELLNDPDKIMNLQYHMILDYTGHVERLQLGKRRGRFTVDVANYIQHHMSEAITTEQIADELFVSRPYLSKRFKQETGVTLTDFILKEKTEEAKRLLRYTDKTLSAIGNYLGFSSQSHFTRVFKKYAGCAPGEYKEKHNRA
ncbi:MAG TPA: helix-turn-helix domain-containing protein [Oscillospiraceae bacterium]|nr:helix-turn-helix domain-containing protein [Oscillospiraceae bacterium]HPS35731.1 helix-turn-helix domain-containing protein [Oscillospiraceae bacterium]